MPSPAEQRLRDGLCHPVDVLVLSHGRPRAELSLSGDPRRPATDVLIRLVREPVNLGECVSQAEGECCAALVQSGDRRPIEPDLFAGADEPVMRDQAPLL
jgi:hypothetical protein